MGMSHDRPTVLGVTPFEEPNGHLAAALARAGALSVLDLGRDAARGRKALADAARFWAGPLGVRVPAGCRLTPADLPASVDLVVLPAGSPWSVAECAPRTVLAEVVSVAEARLAVAAGADAVIAKGAESGGRVGTTNAFILLQQVLDAGLGVDVWAAGGIGPHTAAAAVAGGATGVVLDVQLALVAEAELPREVAAAVRAMDGTETAVTDGRRVLSRRDAPALPVGEDGALAAALADRYRTAGGVVGAVRDAIDDHISSAARSGWRPRVAQGPMTRVSDQAAFAAAVAAEGGLPFIALALMSGEDARALLTETAELLGERPWGVGILGFVPAQVREAQLAAVHDAHPPYALIAGGRPAQAKPLDAAGITTFLHVPSPELLDRFLAEGARRFVFEGSECGGHVGPRASFPLWDMQIERLLAYGEKNGCTGEFDVLFAGGIHDERSAAMIAAAGAPIAARGGACGVLMGTAYLFTAEAVASGAIGPAFQRAAVACESTVLLETAPGHATRCAESPFVRTFTETRERLTAAGLPREEMWAELEKLNLGRLRIASKGIRREGGALIPVDETTQARDGMVMIGDVAVLRTSVTTIAALHAQVTEGAAEFLTARATELGLAGAPAARAASPDPLDIAIVGMAGVFPQAGDLAEFWANVLADHDAITEVPADRWDATTYFEGEGGVGSTSKWGGFLPDIPFDALKYGIPPAALASIEPVQLLSLEVAARALNDAGYAHGPSEPGRPFSRERAGVIFGAEPGTDLSTAYGFRALYPKLHGEMPADLDAQLPTLTEDSFPGVLANVIAGRIANRLDLGGANYTVDAACASALAALEVACMQLRAGAADMVLAGGADIHNGIQDYLLFASVGALSPTGHCKPFDANADGISLGEGVACIVLKRLADAERDGDRIYAVIKAVGSSSDGRSLGLTAPRPEGQRRALERAYETAGISPADVGLVEAHGTGTVVGDRTELGVLTEVFTEAGAMPGTCALGSVKSQIGHTKCTAGLAGLIKAARAVHAGVLPPTGKLSSPNPAWDAATSPFVFDATARPWPAGRPRVAGVSAFGFGGTNFHAVVAAYEGAPLPRHGLDAWPAELFLFSGATDAAAAAEIDRLRALCATNDSAGRPWRLRDLARTAAERSAPERFAGGRGGSVRVAVVATDLDDLAAKLELAAAGTANGTAPGVFLADDPVPAGELAILFPGQGSQRPGMLADLFTTFPRLQHLLATGAQWAPAMFPPATFSPQAAAAARAALTDTRVAQPALGIADLAMYETLTAFGVRPDHLAGHSYGELVALAAAGALDPSELFELSAARGRAILAAAGDDPGTMAAVSAGAADTKRALNGTPVVIANHNGPGQTVISGPTAAIETALGKLAAAGLSAQKIPVACAFHSPVVADAAGTLAAELARRTVTAPHLPVWSNTTASPYPMGSTAVRETLADQVALPVRFVDQIEAMYAAGVRVFVEAGPGRVLTGLVGAILSDRPHVAVATDAPGRHAVHTLLLALGRLAVAGVSVDAGALFAGRDADVVSAEKAPRRPGWVVNGHLVRTADGAPVANGLRPAETVTLPTAPAPAEVTQAAPAVAVAPAHSDARDGVVLEFLRSTREIVAAQRDVLLGYLGTAPAAPTVVVPAVLAPPAVTPAAVAPAAVTATAVAPAVVPAQAPVEVVAVATAAPAFGPDEVMAALVDIVATRTGYPAEMLGADLDLEADLSIASLKRTEIVGLLADRLSSLYGAAAAPDEHQQSELSRLRTLRAVVDAVAEGTASAVAAAPAATLTTLPAPAPAAASVTFGPDEVMAALVDIVATRTGYPAEMLGADLDLEADLSIASLKRTEIVGLLADRLSSLYGAAAAPDEHQQSELSRLRTLRAIVDALTAPEAAPATAPVVEEVAPDPVAAALAVAPRPERARPALARRYLLAPVPMAPAHAVGDLTGRHVTIVTGGVELGTALGSLLQSRGAAVRTVSADPSTELGDVDILVHLGAACPTDPPSLPDAFALLRKAVLGGARQLVVVTGSGGRFGHRSVGDAPPLTDAPAGMGLPGLVRTIAREYPEIAARAVDLDPKESAQVLAGRLLGELLNPVGPEVVGHAGETRYTLELVRAPLSPAKERAARKAAIGINADSVVLLTGGARGITARVALGLAKATGCHVVLWGRTPLPAAEEDAATAAAREAVALRRALIAAGVSTPAEVEAASRRILADREIRSAMTQLGACAASVHYATVDVRDSDAVRAGVDAVYARYGRLDGVVHGAGVLDDRLIADKTPEGFASVWQTKVDGARALSAAVSRDLRFLVLFGSVSGVFGNRGQCDYAAANDAMDCLARHWAGSFSGRVLSIDWGPWLPTEADGGDSGGTGSGVGMVSDALLKQYARDGVEAIHPDDGVDCMLAELAHGAEPQVVYVCAEPSAFDVAFGGANRPSTR